MEHLSPLGPVFQSGTLAGNPLATAAGRAVLGELDRRRVHGAVRRGPAAWRRSCATPAPAAGDHRPVPGRRHARRHPPRRCRAHRLRGSQAHRRAGLRTHVPRAAGRRRGAGARCLRGRVRRPCPHRRRSSPRSATARPPPSPPSPPACAAGELRGARSPRLAGGCGGSSSRSGSGCRSSPSAAPARRSCTCSVRKTDVGEPVRQAGGRRSARST